MNKCDIAYKKNRNFTLVTAATNKVGDNGLIMKVKNLKLAIMRVLNEKIVVRGKHK